MASICLPLRLIWLFRASSATIVAAPIACSAHRQCLTASATSTWVRSSSSSTHITPSATPSSSPLQSHQGHVASDPLASPSRVRARTSKVKVSEEESDSLSTSPSLDTPPSSAPRRSTKAYAELPTHALNAEGESTVALEPFTPRNSRRSTQKRGRKSKDTNAAEQSSPNGQSAAPTQSHSSSTQDHDCREGAGDVVVPRLDELGPEGQAWPPLAKDVLTNMARFPGCILLTRVGGFYESYFDQAPPLSILLSIKLATRTWGGRPVPMAGFPLSQLEKYLKILVEDNRKLVAICEEFRSDESGVQGESPVNWKMINALKTGSKGLAVRDERFNEKIEITRRVTRVVSPGTLIDEKWMNPLKNNFMLSIARMTKEDLMSESPDDHRGFGLAWLDLSTSDLHVSQCQDLESLRDEIRRISPSEVILEQNFAFPRVKGDEPSASGEVADSGNNLWQMLDGERTLLSYVTPPANHATSSVEASNLEAEATHSYTPVERRALINLTSHLRRRLIALSSQSTQSETGEIDNMISSGVLIKHHIPSETMHIDCNTLDALEVCEATREGGVRGSLVSTVRRTISKGGARLLLEWLTSPSTSYSVIAFRHSLVALLLSRPFLHEDLRSHFKRRIARGDISRTIQRIASGRNDEQDLLEVKDFVKFISELKETVKQDLDAAEDKDQEEGKINLTQLCNELIELKSLGDQLEGAIDERVMEIRSRAMEAMNREDDAQEDGSDGVEIDVVSKAKSSSTAAGAESASTTAKKGGEEPWGPPFEHLIRPSSCQQLLSLTNEYESLRQEASALQASLRTRFSNDKISLRFLLGQGFVVHFADYRPVSKDTSGPQADPEEHFTLAYRTKSTRTFYFDRWSSLGSRLLRLQEELKRAESLELRRLRSLVVQSSSTLRANARKIDELDCLMGFATLASELTLIRPEILKEEGVFEVRGGRHIGVELGLLERTPARPFHSNDLIMSPILDAEGEGGGRLHFITGPNMGGKSTYLRQNALIAILAQAGSFVPATEARLSIVDRLFSRVGAKDDLFRDRSTFMVEMLETSEILRRATSRSFVIADEIGRGTTTNVGIAIAFATLTELSKIGCRALFATHLHELADRMGYEERTYRGSKEFSHVRFASTDVVQGKDTITYLHTLRPGINRESHGLTVAALAGMPASALEVAKETLRSLTSQEVEGRL